MLGLNGVAITVAIAIMLAICLIMHTNENNFKQPQKLNRKCNVILQRIKQWAMKKILPVMSTKILIKFKAMY